MPSASRSPADHYQEAERLLDVADHAAARDATPVLQRIRDEALLEAGVHATLALAPRRVRRKRRDHDDPQPTGSPQHRWLHGSDE